MSPRGPASNLSVLPVALPIFTIAAYLSDLALDVAYQQQGIGKQLQHLTQQQLEPTCKLILLAAPSANSYYEPLGFKHNPRCWVLAAD